MGNQFLYIVLSYGIQFINIVLNFVFLQRLPINVLGDVAVAKIWMQAFDYTHLGTRFSLDRYLPVLKRGEHKQLYLVASLMIVFMGSTSVFFIQFIFEGINKVVISFCLVGAFLSVANIVKAYFRAIGDISEVNKVVFYLYFTPLLLSLFGALCNFEFFIIIYPILFFGGLLYYSFKYKGWYKNLKIKRLPNIILRLRGISFLLFINAIIGYFLLIVDRLVVDYFLGRESLGEYSVILFVFSCLFMVPSIITELIFPKIIKQVVTLKKMIFTKEILIVFFSTTIIVLIANILIEFLVANFTSYSELIPLMRLISVAVIPYSITAVFYHVYNALDKRLLLMKVNLALLVAVIIVYVSSFALFAGVGLSTIVYLKLCTSILTMIFISLPILSLHYRG